ncbi:MAG: hypothetical protein V1908_01380 [Candidatus Peregrinibacteria bacterium]
MSATVPDSLAERQPSLDNLSSTRDVLTRLGVTGEERPGRFEQFLSAAEELAPGIRECIDRLWRGHTLNHGEERTGGADGQPPVPLIGFVDTFAQKRDYPTYGARAGLGDTRQGVGREGGGSADIVILNTPYRNTKLILRHQTVGASPEGADIDYPPGGSLEFTVVDYEGEVSVQCIDYHGKSDYGAELTQLEIVEASHKNIGDEMKQHPELGNFLVAFRDQVTILLQVGAVQRMVDEFPIL